MGVAFARPETLDEALAELRRDDDVHLLAGGVSLVLLMNSGFMHPERIVSLAGVPELRGVTSTDDGLHLGAGSTHHELANDPLVREHLPAAAEMFSRIGNVRVRMAGTLGGNLAHADPAQDPATVLAVLDAVAVVVGPEGTRDVPVEQLADGPLSPTIGEDEIITRVRVPWPSAGVRCSYLKFLSGTKDDYATVSVACRLTLDDAGSVSDAALAAAAVGPTVMVLDEVARLLVGQEVDDDVLARVEEVAAGSVRPHGDRRGSAEYKQAMTGVIAADAVRKAVGAASATSR